MFVFRVRLDIDFDCLTSDVLVSCPVLHIFDNATSSHRHTGIKEGCYLSLRTWSGDLACQGEQYIHPERIR